MEEPTNSQLPEQTLCFTETANFVFLSIAGANDPEPETRLSFSEQLLFMYWAVKESSPKSVVWAKVNTTSSTPLYSSLLV